MKFALLLLLTLASTAQAQDDVACVRNYLTGGLNTCENGTKDWTYLYNADPQAKFETCTRRQPDHNCELAQDFIWVIAKPSREKVCVLRFDNQIADLCQNFPDKYSYIYINGQN